MLLKPYCLLVPVVLLLTGAVLQTECAKKKTKQRRSADAKDGVFDTKEVHVRYIKEQITREIVTSSGQRALMTDKFISPDLISQTESLLLMSSWWSFQQANFSSGSDQVVEGDGIPWGAQYDAVEFLTYPLGQQLQKLVHYLAGDFVESSNEKDAAPADAEEKKKKRRSSVVKEDVRPFLPYDVRWKVVRRGDLTTLHRGSSEETGEVWTALFLTYNWGNNNYGDLFLYDDEDEILGGANPVLGRVVAWNATLGYLVRPPCIDFSRGENVLIIRWTRDEAKLLAFESKRAENSKQVQDGIRSGFALSGVHADAAPTIDVSSHEVLHRTSSIGKNIYAFDGIFDEEDLRELRRYIVRHGTVFYDDSEDLGTSDNVQWISGFEVSSFVQSKFWRIVKQIATYVSKGEGDWYPYDVSCNVIRSYDHTRLHGDVRNGADDEWTFLLYLSDMKSGDYGETAYFEKNSDNTELVYQVRAEYGRAVIFEGLIPHAARPPSPAFVGPRYSFAVKMAKTPFRALSHVLHEKHNQNDMMLSQIYQRRHMDSERYVKLQEKKAAGSVEKLNATLNKYIDQVDKSREKTRKMELRYLLNPDSD